jgi:nucleotide-binding universal stress UspA family protein
MGRRHSPFKKILIGVDGSQQSEKATEIGLALAQSLDSRVLLFAVARHPEAAATVDLSAMLDDAREHFEEKFKNAVEGNSAESKPAGPGKGVL